MNFSKFHISFTSYTLALDKAKVLQFFCKQAF